MESQTGTVHDPNPPLEDVIAEYLSAEFDGAAPSRSELLEQHPGLADELQKFFVDHDCMNRIVNAVPASPSQLPLPIDSEFADTQEFGDYELLEEIGRGGMGVVYRARQVSLNRIVALKMILSGRLAGAEDIARFRTEAEAAANLDHSGIVPVYESGQHAGFYYFSMAWIDGCDLARKLSDGPLPPSEAAQLTQRVAEAVHHANTHGVIHRDLKPANILLDEQEQPRITDFGLARLMSHESDLTSTGAVVGTAGYMAPEQAAGQAILPTTTVDVYAVGAVLYALLTGRPPFQAATQMETLIQVQNQEPIPPRQFDSGVPRDLETICMKCLQKHPTQRYATAGDMADDVQRFMEGKPILARPVSKLVRAARWSRRNLLSTALSVMLVTSLISGISVSVYFGFAAHQKAEIATQAGQHANDMARAAQRAENDAIEKLRKSYLESARAHRWSGRSGRRFDALEALEKAVAIRPSEELRDEVIACLGLVDLRVANRQLPVAKGTREIAFDKSFERYATACGNGDLVVRSVESGERLMQFPAEDTRNWHLHFSPDGRFLAAFHREKRTGIVFDLQLKKEILRVPCRSYLANGEAFSADSRYIAIGHRSGGIDVYGLPSGKHMRLLNPSLKAGVVAVAPDDKHLAIGRFDEAIRICEPETGTVIRTLEHSFDIHDIAWHPDGQVLATAGDGGHVHIWDALTGQLRATAKPGEFVSRIDFSHSGRLLATSGWDGIVRLLNPLNGDTLVSLTHDVRVLQFSSDDRWLAGNVDGTQATIFEVADSLCPRIGKGDKRGAAFDTAGRLLANASDEGVRIFDVPACREVAFLPLEYSKSVVFPQTGDCLITSGLRHGVTRWPLQWAEGDSHRLVSIGPPQQLLSGSTSRLSACPSNSSLAVSYEITTRKRARILDLAGSPTWKRLKSGSYGRHISLSPDGKWIATATFKGTGVKIWNAATGEREKSLPVAGSAMVKFSPDGQWLMTGNAEVYKFWRVGTWCQSKAIERTRDANLYGMMEFSPDSSTVVLNHSRYSLKVFDVSTGEQLATLGDRRQYPLCYNHDGTGLAVLDKDEQLLRIWDLDGVRSHLQGMGLGWDLTSASSSMTSGLNFPPRPLVIYPASHIETSQERKPGVSVAVSDLTAGSNKAIVIDVPAELLNTTNLSLSDPISCPTGSVVLILSHGTFPAETTIDLLANVPESLPSIYCYEAGSKWRFVSSYVERSGEGSRVVLRPTSRPLRYGDQILLKSELKQAYLRGEKHHTSVTATAASEDAIWTIVNPLDQNDESTVVRLDDLVALRNVASNMYLGDGGSGASLNVELTERARWRLLDAGSNKQQNAAQLASGTSVNIRSEATVDWLKAYKDRDSPKVVNGQGSQAVWRLYAVPKTVPIAGPRP